MKGQYDIFISYRRIDSEGRTSGRDIARTIKLEFEKRGYVVFFDYSEIKDDEFERVIIPAIESSKVFVLVLSKDALVRVVNEKDWVRREIEAAIQSGCKLIPINPDGAFTNWPPNLPDSIRSISKHQISEISMGSLFEKSIDKIEEERFAKTSRDKEMSQRLRSMSFFFLYFVLGVICCYYCVRSIDLTLGLNIPMAMIWPIIIALFILFSLGMRAISTSFDSHKYAEGHRIRYYLVGVSIAIIYGIFFIVPCQTHALYYNFTIKDEVRADLGRTKKYLQEIQKAVSDRNIKDEIGNIEKIEKKIAYGQLNLNKKKEIQKIDSILLIGYNIIRNQPEVNYESIDDKICYSSEKLETRIDVLMNMFLVWSRQMQLGPSTEFFFALVISILLSVSSTMLYLKGMSF